MVKVERHDDYHFLLKGEVDEVWNGADLLPSPLNADMIQADIELIVNGFLWPRIGWDIVFMLGFQPRPEVTHHKQVVPPPHRAWVDSAATNEDLLFSKKSCLRTHSDEGACSLSTERMALLHETSKHISELSDYSSSIRDNTDKRSIDLISGMSAASQILYSVKNFEMNLIKHINPHAGSVDECFIPLVIHHDETSRKGMMKTFLELAKHMQLLTYEMEGEMIGRGKLLPNALKRVVNIQLDALSSQNYRSLLLRSSSHVIDIIKALKRITCQHDYLHEIRMHRQDVIWRVFYGGFLQPLVVHLGWKRITGNPVKKGLQHHENFLVVPYRGARARRLDQFLSSQGKNFFSTRDGETPEAWLSRIDAVYREYCRFWEEETSDEPSKAVAMFLKTQESYLRGSGTISSKRRRSAASFAHLC